MKAQRPHADTPYTSSGSYFGWCSCMKCCRRERGMPWSGGIEGNYDFAVWHHVRKWHERIYKEMWEDFWRET